MEAMKRSGNIKLVVLDLSIVFMIIIKCQKGFTSVWQNKNCKGKGEYVQ